MNLGSMLRERTLPATEHDQGTETADCPNRPVQLWTSHPLGRDYWIIRVR
jgi:hypothetical protein